MESTFYAAGGRYNVMVFNLSQNYEDRFNGVKLSLLLILVMLFTVFGYSKAVHLKITAMAAGITGRLEAGLTAKINSLRSTVLNSRFYPSIIHAH